MVNLASYLETRLFRFIPARGQPISVDEKQMCSTEVIGRSTAPIYLNSNFLNNIRSKELVCYFLLYNWPSRLSPVTNRITLVSWLLADDRRIKLANIELVQQEFTGSPNAGLGFKRSFHLPQAYWLQDSELQVRSTQDTPWSHLVHAFWT